MNFKRGNDVRWDHLALARNLWRALVKTVKISWFYGIFGNFL
jgi:hypothetical protein